MIRLPLSAARLSNSVRVRVASVASWVRTVPFCLRYPGASKRSWWVPGKSPMASPAAAVTSPSGPSTVQVAPSRAWPERFVRLNTVCDGVMGTTICTVVLPSPGMLWVRVPGSCFGAWAVPSNTLPRTMTDEPLLPA